MDPAVHLSVKWPFEGKVLVSVPGTETVEKAVSLCGFSAPQDYTISVVHNGKVLNPALTLDFYRIKDGSSLFVALLRPKARQIWKKAISNKESQRMQRPRQWRSEAIRIARETEADRLTDLSIMSWEMVPRGESILASMIETDSESNLEPTEETQISFCREIKDEPLPNCFSCPPKKSYPNDI